LYNFSRQSVDRPHFRLPTFGRSTCHKTALSRPHTLTKTTTTAAVTISSVILDTTRASVPPNCTDRAKSDSHPAVSVDSSPTSFGRGRQLLGLFSDQSKPPPGPVDPFQLAARLVGICAPLIMDAQPNGLPGVYELIVEVRAYYLC
ncbi:unnamed protein product, partial [Protopolystoma xenopodis]